MPNWCMNNLYLTCTPRQFKKFVATYIVKGDDPDELEFAFDKADPTPQEMLDAGSPCKPEEQKRFKKLYGFIDWYEWRIAHWGTKWAPTVNDIEDNRIRFDSAWSPPLKVLKTISRLSPDIKFELDYLEEGNGFGGRFTVKGGKVTRNKYFDSSDDPEGYQKMLTIFGVNWEPEDEENEDA